MTSEKYCTAFQYCHAKALMFLMAEAVSESARVTCAARGSPLYCKCTTNIMLLANLSPRKNNTVKAPHLHPLLPVSAPRTGHYCFGTSELNGTATTALTSSAIDVLNRRGTVEHLTVQCNRVHGSGVQYSTSTKQLNTVLDSQKPARTHLSYASHIRRFLELLLENLKASRMGGA